jgi:hypothetical protein
MNRSTAVMDIKTRLLRATGEGSSGEKRCKKAKQVTMNDFLHKVTKQKNDKTCNAVQRNSEARSCSHRCRGIAISITYSECVFVALGTQHAMPHIITCNLTGCTTFLHIIS